MVESSKNLGLLKNAMFGDDLVVAIPHNLATDNVLHATATRLSEASGIVEINFDEQRVIKAGSPSEFLRCGVSLTTGNLELDGENIEPCDFSGFVPGKPFLPEEEIKASLICFTEVSRNYISSDEDVQWLPCDDYDAWNAEGGKTDEVDIIYDNMTNENIWRCSFSDQQLTKYILVVRGVKSDVFRAFMLVGYWDLVDNISSSWNDTEDNKEGRHMLIRYLISSFDEAVKGVGKEVIKKKDSFSEVLKAMDL